MVMCLEKKKNYSSWEKYVSNTIYSNSSSEFSDDIMIGFCKKAVNILPAWFGCCM